MDQSPLTFSQALKAALLLEIDPVGVRLLRTPADLADSTLPRPAAALHYCLAVDLASKGESFALAPADIACNTAPRTLGMTPGLLDGDFVESYVTGELYTEVDDAHDILAGVAALDGVSGVEVAPLETFSADLPPDVVVVPSPPVAAMRIAQAVTYQGGRLHSAMIGMHGVCSESTAAPAVTGNTSVSLLCSGTRHVAGWADELLSVGIPYERLAGLVEVLARTAERYEPDERKEQIRERVGPNPQFRASLADGLLSLSDGAGYFYGCPERPPGAMPEDAQTDR